jgi:hypothetical protein
MITLTLDDAALALLRQAAGLSEIRDSSGQVVGFFAPATMSQARLYAQAAAQTDPAEVKRRVEAGATELTAQEMVERLQSLG